MKKKELTEETTLGIACITGLVAFLLLVYGTHMFFAGVFPVVLSLAGVILSFIVAAYTNVSDAAVGIYAGISLGVVLATILNVMIFVANIIM